MPKILNSIRGSGANITERAAKLARRQYRNRNQSKPASTVIRTEIPENLMRDTGRRKHRTILWP